MVVDVAKERHAALREVPCFGALSGRGLEVAAKALKLATFERDEYAKVEEAVVSVYCGAGHFGERAIVSNEPQAASIRVTSATLVCFHISRSVFRNVMTDLMTWRPSIQMMVGLTKERILALRDIELLRSLNSRELELAVKDIDVVSFKRGDCVLRQGEQGSSGRPSEPFPIR